MGKIFYKLLIILFLSSCTVPDWVDTSRGIFGTDKKIDYPNDVNQKKVFDATLTLKEKSVLSFNNLLLHSLRFPFITLMVFFRIHIQAFTLWIKGATFYDHPKYEENN